MKKTTEDDIARHPELEGLEGYLWRREGARLAWLAQRVPDGQVIVELGSNRGKSTCFLAAGSKDGARVKVHCVDLWDLSGQQEYQHLGFDLPETYATFQRQVAEARCKTMVVEHRGDSALAGLEWDGPPIGLLFIDADHRYEAVRDDTEAWLPHVASGGWVCWHDYTRTFGREVTHFPGVEQYVDEWLAANETVEVTRTGRLVAARLP